MEKRYIGDGVYVDFDGYALVLTAENGIEATDRIVLEPDIYAALIEYVRALKEDQERPALHESAQPCGCDPGASWVCEAHR